MANVINATSTGNGGLITTGDDSGVLNIQTNETTAVSIDASQNVDFTNNIDAPNTFGFKNRIINGAMVIDQRNAGASVSITGTGTYTYTLDRWRGYCSVTAKYTVQQTPSATETGYATRVAAGFQNYLAATSSSAYSVGTGETFFLSQVIEGFNVADLAWGTANAQPITLSFWARSSITGTHGGSLRNADSPSRSYPFSFTVNSANTWEQKTVTISGDQSGTWNTTNGQGIQIQFNLSSGATFQGTAGSWQAGNLIAPTGAVSVLGTNGATFYITGVQLEKGTQATSFDFRSYGTELALCQRYYYRIVSSGSSANILGVGLNDSTTTAQIQFSYPVTMRTSPTSIEQSGTATNYALRTSAGATTCSAVPAFVDAGQYTATVLFTVASGLTTGGAALGRAATAGAYIGFPAEL